VLSLLVLGPTSLIVVVTHLNAPRVSERNSAFLYRPPRLIKRSWKLLVRGVWV
jgi:hypothetical protein